MEGIIRDDIISQIAKKLMQLRMRIKAASFPLKVQKYEYSAFFRTSFGVFFIEKQGSFFISRVISKLIYHLGTVVLLAQSGGGFLKQFVKLSCDELGQKMNGTVRID